MSQGKILRVKYGYNPNSSSIGSETTGAIADLLRNASKSSSVLMEKTTTSLGGSSFWSTFSQYSTLDLIKYSLGSIFAAIIIFFVSKKLYFKIKFKIRKNKKKHENKI